MATWDHALVVTVLAILGVLAVLFVAAVLATREGPELADAPRDAPDLALPVGPLSADDVAEVRFDLALRGYRMSEVDEVLDRLAAELRARDERIAALEAHLPEQAGPVRPTPSPVEEPRPSDPSPTLTESDR